MTEFSFTPDRPLPEMEKRGRIAIFQYMTLMRDAFGLLPSTN